MGTEFRFFIGGLMIGIAMGFCLASIYWNWELQKQKDNKLRYEINIIKNKISDMSENTK